MPVSIHLLLLCLVLSPLGMFVCHAVTYRALALTGRRATAHISAVAGIGVWFVVLLALIRMLAWPALAGPQLLCVVVYVLAVYGALSVLYLDVVNIAETSLHMHLLLEIAWSDRPSLRWLLERYSPERMIDERLDRLTALGQIRFTDGRYHLASRFTLRLNRAVDIWRAVLGLPTSPDRVAAR